MCSPYSQAGGGHETNRQLIGGRASTGAIPDTTTAQVQAVVARAVGEAGVVPIDGTSVTGSAPWDSSGAFPSSKGSSSRSNGNAQRASCFRSRTPPQGGSSRCSPPGTTRCARTNALEARPRMKSTMAQSRQRSGGPTVAPVSGSRCECATSRAESIYRSSRSSGRRRPGGDPALAAVAPEEGFEPPTRRLTAACSTTELLRNIERKAGEKYHHDP